MSFGAIAQQGPKEKDPFMQNSIFEKTFEFFFCIFVGWSKIQLLSRSEYDPVKILRDCCCSDNNSIKIRPVKISRSVSLDISFA